MNLRNSALVESIDWPEKDPQVRITVSTLNALMSARYQAYLFQLRQWFFETTGESFADIDDWPEETLNRCTHELNFGVSAAQNLASISSVEVLDDSGEWKKIPTPAAWLTFDGYLENIDPTLSDIWNDAAIRVNPSLWEIDESEEGKKKGEDKGSE